MNPDPSTPEGLEEIKRRIEKRKSEAQSVRERASKDPDSEPSGKLTNPSDLDKHSDRRDHE